MTYFRTFTYIIVFILLFFLFGCDELEHQNKIMIKVDEEWQNKTINKVISGYNIENKLFTDYNEKNVELTADEIWRSIEMYNLIGYSFDKELLMESFSNVTPRNIRERLEYDYICNLLDTDECEIFYSDYNVLVKELYSKNFNIDEIYEILDAFYILINNFLGKLNESSKSRIENWIMKNEKYFQDDIGLLYSILEIEHNLNREFITIKNTKKYEQLLVDVLNKDDSNLIEIFYLYFINVYLGNSYNKELIAIKIAEYYNKEYGFSLSINDYVDGNLGSYLGVRVFSSLGKLKLFQADLLRLFKNSEDTYGGFVNKENIQNGSVEETIMANFLLVSLNEKPKNSIEYIDFNNLNWYWTYYGLLQYHDEITVESKNNLLKSLEMFEFEILNTDFSEEIYDQLLTSSGIINEIEHFSKVGILLEYSFNKDYEDKLKQISNGLMNMITRREIDVLSSIISLNDIFELNLDKKNLEFLTTKALNNNNPDNFYEWYSVIKAANILGLFKDQNLDLYKFLNPNGGVNGDLNIESSDTLFSTFLMLSLAKIIE